MICHMLCNVYDVCCPSLLCGAHAQVACRWRPRRHPCQAASIQRLPPPCGGSQLAVASACAPPSGLPARRRASFLQSVNVFAWGVALGVRSTCDLSCHSYVRWPAVRQGANSFVDVTAARVPPCEHMGHAHALQLTDPVADPVIAPSLMTHVHPCHACHWPRQQSEVLPLLATRQHLLPLSPSHPYLSHPSPESLIREMHLSRAAQVGSRSRE